MREKYEKPQMNADERRFIDIYAPFGTANDRQEIIDKIREIISRFDDVDIAYIFGSFLERDKFGDIDVAVVLSKKLDPYGRFKFAMKIARELEKGVKPRFEFDVKILNYSPVEFQREVLKKGKVVFLRNENRRIEYEFEIISKYLDIRDMYEFIDKKFLARV
jgi:predicted nucleotidyltransferase